MKSLLVFLFLVCVGIVHCNPCQSQNDPLSTISTILLTGSCVQFACPPGGPQNTICNASQLQAVYTIRWATSGGNCDLVLPPGNHQNLGINQFNGTGVNSNEQQTTYFPANSIGLFQITVPQDAVWTYTVCSAAVLTNPGYGSGCQVLTSAQAHGSCVVKK